MALVQRVAARYRELQLIRRVAEEYAKLSYNPAASREFDEAITYYETTVDEQTATRFTMAVVDQVKEIRRAPNQWPQTPGARPGVRKVQVDTKHNKPRWPYSIVYQSGKTRQGESRVRIIAVAHHKRKPLYWKNRT